MTIDFRHGARGRARPAHAPHQPIRGRSRSCGSAVKALIDHALDRFCGRPGSCRAIRQRPPSRLISSKPMWPGSPRPSPSRSRTSATLLLGRRAEAREAGAARCSVRYAFLAMNSRFALDRRAGAQYSGTCCPSWRPAMRWTACCFSPTSGTSLGYDVGFGDFPIASEAVTAAPSRARRHRALRLCGRRHLQAREFSLDTPDGLVLAQRESSTVPSRPRGAATGLVLDGEWLHVGTPEAIPAARDRLAALPRRSPDETLPFAWNPALSIPAGAAFLPTLADALLDGTLTGGWPDGMGLCRRDVSLSADAASRSRAVAALSPNARGPARAPPAAHRAARRCRSGGVRPRRGRPANRPSKRPRRWHRRSRRWSGRLILTRLVQRWAAAVSPDLHRLPPGVPFLVPSSPADAVNLAADLELLMDALAVEEVPWRRDRASRRERVLRVLQARRSTSCASPSRAGRGSCAERGASDPAHRRQHPDQGGGGTASARAPADADHRRRVDGLDAVDRGAPCRDRAAAERRRGAARPRPGSRRRGLGQDRPPRRRRR